MTTAETLVIHIIIGDSSPPCWTHPDTTTSLSGCGWNLQFAPVDDEPLRYHDDVGERQGGVSTVDDTKVLTDLNLRFIEAFRQGSWELLEPILSPSFSYLDGATGEVWDQERYIEDLRRNPLPTIGIDQVVVHVDGDVAVVSARSFTRPEKFNRYIDTYERRENGWVCVHACIWPCSGAGASAG